MVYWNGVVGGLSLIGIGGGCRLIAEDKRRNTLPELRSIAEICKELEHGNTLSGNRLYTSIECKTTRPKFWMEEVKLTSGEDAVFVRQQEIEVLHSYEWKDDKEGYWERYQREIPVKEEVYGAPLFLKDDTSDTLLVVDHSAFPTYSMMIEHTFNYYKYPQKYSVKRINSFNPPQDTVIGLKSIESCIPIGMKVFAVGDVYKDEYGTLNLTNHGDGKLSLLKYGSMVSVSNNLSFSVRTLSNLATLSFVTGVVVVLASLNAK